MAIPWLLALKVIPWGDVIEHAPKVLNAARKLMDRTPAPASGSAGASVEVLDPNPGHPPSLGELKNRLIEARQLIDQQARTQEQMAQTLTELAEQNARLVGAVEMLRLRTLLR
ncbi:MAG: hypothetical protein MUF76_13795 [Hydrogenophaga sp.]|nr:hypothetical protein [Hydrogenophaga sp.]